MIEKIVREIIERKAWTYDEKGRLALIGTTDFLAASREIVNNFVLIPKDLAKEFCRWSDSRAFCNSGQHIVDRLSVEIEQQTND